MGADDQRFLVVTLRGTQGDPTAGCGVACNCEIRIGYNDFTLGGDSSTNSKHTDARTLSRDTCPETARSAVVEIRHFDYLPPPTADALCSKPLCPRKRNHSPTLC